MKNRSSTAPSRTGRSIQKSILLASVVTTTSLLVSTATAVDYSQKIKPLLAEKCGACHGAIKQEGDLRLDHGEFIRQGGESGAIVGTKDSILMHRITSQDDSERMPPAGEGTPLDQEQIQLLASWIEAGAITPANEPVPVGPDEHWAWQSPRRSQLPSEIPDHLRHNPIDTLRFITLAEQGLEPAPISSPANRLRRLSLDLTGLPPTADAIRNFDGSSEQWIAWTDRMLADPAFGQRWARHWMDVWRYSDWDGYKDELRGSQRHIWRWRDWIVQSLNADKGYNQMIVEMLAGDEVAPEDEQVLAATGFLARNFHKSNRDIWLDATVEHTAKAFLAMTINCARCHDHKYDPIGQTEYYAMRAVFEPHRVRTEQIPGEMDILKDGLVRAYDAELDQPTFVYLAGNEKNPDKDHPIQPAALSVINLPFEVSEIELPPRAFYPSLQRFYFDQEKAQLEATLNEARKEQDATHREGFAARIASQAISVAQANIQSLEARWAADQARYTGKHRGTPEHSLQVNELSLAAAIAERAAALATAELQRLKKEDELAKLTPGNYESLPSAETDENVAPDEKEPQHRKAENEKAIAAAKKALKAACEAVDAARKAYDELTSVRESNEPLPATEYSPVGTIYPHSSTGRRLALARWITHPNNPLTARVAVNHIWLRLMGKPLVDNVFDFGMRSPPPPQQRILDWLACELVEHDWSLKHIVRMIVTSQTYQADSAYTQLTNLEIDPDNKTFWRGETRRLDAEAIRDSLLAIGGELDRTFGGPELPFATGEKTPRRSLYFQHAYEKQMLMLVLFDAAAPSECYQRTTSIVPQQALALANSPLSFDQSRRLAHKLWSHKDQSDAVAIEQAFVTLFARPCSSEELSVCLTFLSEQAVLLEGADSLELVNGEANANVLASEDSQMRARENLIHALVNHNDFVTLR